MSKHQQAARRIEMLILCGCSICGRRLIDNGKRVEGIYVLRGAVEAREVWCQGCLKEIDASKTFGKLS